MRHRLLSLPFYLLNINQIYIYLNEFRLIDDETKQKAKAPEFILVDKLIWKTWEHFPSKASHPSPLPRWQL